MDKNQYYMLLTILADNGIEPDETGVVAEAILDAMDINKLLDDIISETDDEFQRDYPKILAEREQAMHSGKDCEVVCDENDIQEFENILG